jgi:Family of unknown function (DUF5335)
MGIRRLERWEWCHFCAFASRYVIGRRADIELLSFRFGRRVPVQQMPVLGLNYDPRRDIIKILLAAADHQIHRPREMHVDLRPICLANFTVIDADGTQEIIVLHEPVLLAAPSRT